MGRQQPPPLVLQRRYGGDAVAMVGASNGLRPPHGTARRRGRVSTRARQSRWTLGATGTADANSLCGQGGLGPWVTCGMHGCARWHRASDVCGLRTSRWASLGQVLQGCLRPSVRAGELGRGAGGGCAWTTWCPSTARGPGSHRPARARMGSCADRQGPGRRHGMRVERARFLTMLQCARAGMGMLCDEVGMLAIEGSTARWAAARAVAEARSGHGF